MFKLVLNSIQKTVNYIAPPLESSDEFKFHCQIIKEYFLNEQNLDEINNKVVEDTLLPKHLNMIMGLLLEDNERLFLTNKHLENNQINRVDQPNNNEHETVNSASIQESSKTLSFGENAINNQDYDQSILNAEITISTLMECLLSNKILEIIINAAKFDLPVGIRLHCYKFLSRLLKDYKVNLLNHCSILNQINELISMCAINTAGPYEQSQIEFLSIIVNKIQQNYDLIHAFTRCDFSLLSSLISMLSSPDCGIADKSGQLLIDLVSIAEEDVAKIILNRTLFKNKIIDNLIYHYKQIPCTINPEDIETILNLQDQNLNDSLSSLSYHLRKFLTFFKWFSFLDLVLVKCKSTNLSLSLLEVFKDNFLEINLSQNLFLKEKVNLNITILSTILIFACLKHCKSTLLKESIINYLLDEHSLIRKEVDNTYEKVDMNNSLGLLAGQFNQVNLIDNQISSNLNDQLISKPNDQLSDQQNHQFNNPQNNLTDNKLNQPSNPLFNQFDKNPDKLQDNKLSDKVLNNGDKLSNNNDKLLNKRKILVERCRIKIEDNVSYQFLFRLNLENKIEKEIYNRYLLNLYSLQLFEEIFNKITKSLFEDLFIKNLINRSYLDMSRYNINNDLNELEDLNKMNDIKLEVSNQQLNDEQLNEEQNENLTLSLIHNPEIKSITYFVSLIPNELKSCESDFEIYIEETQKRFDECLQLCENWKWSKEIQDDYFKGQKEQEFRESDFISMLFDNLEQIIKIPYELELQISSLIAKISLFPHPNLNEYLLNPNLPFKENCRSLFSILHKIVDELQIKVLGVKQLKVKLNVIRTYLLGERADLNGFNITKEDQKILEAIIILEEFCKELASLGFVKNTYLL